MSINLLELAKRDVKQSLEQSTIQCINSLLYACAILSHKQLVQESIEDSVRMIRSAVPGVKVIGAIKISNDLVNISSLVCDLIPQHAVDLLCYALAQLELADSQRAEIISIAIILDHHSNIGEKNHA
jgi:hypothetical protein